LSIPPTISVTVGRLDAAAAFDPVVLELPELLQAARPAARAATLATLAILMRVGLDIEVLLVIGGVVSLSVGASDAGIGGFGG
jgi:hypothetical protein